MKYSDIFLTLFTCCSNLTQTYCTNSQKIYNSIKMHNLKYYWYVCYYKDTIRKIIRKPQGGKIFWRTL